LKILDISAFFGKQIGKNEQPILAKFDKKDQDFNILAQQRQRSTIIPNANYSHNARSRNQDVQRGTSDRSIFRTSWLRKVCFGRNSMLEGGSAVS